MTTMNQDKQHNKIDNSNGSIHVSVEDDGSGFHINEVLSADSGRRNLGIETLRQQAEALVQHRARYRQKYNPADHDADRQRRAIRRRGCRATRLGLL